MARSNEAKALGIKMGDPFFKPNISWKRTMWQEREQKLSSAFDSINGAFSRGTVKFAIQGSGQIKSSSQRQSPHYITLWRDIPKVSVK